MIEPPGYPKRVLLLDTQRTHHRLCSCYLFFAIIVWLRIEIQKYDAGQLADDNETVFYSQF